MITPARGHTATTLSSLHNRTTTRRHVSTPNSHEHYKKHLAPVWLCMSQIVVDSATGSWITATTGEKYLDFTSGIGVVNTGHRHPKVVKAIRDQIESGIIHAQLNILFHKPVLELAARLSKLVPQKDLNPQLFFSNSGAEAVEASIKLARHATKKQNIICFEGGLHGRTIGTEMSFPS